ncbi:MAG: single-strand DNA-binding protein [Chitinophagales bacterium]|jgi:single-strand DNA-binding protein|tara:strand:+ start:55 stop:396 length:342 start_codon:yes stop_codon:yes gene_type:complete
MTTLKNHVQLIGRIGSDTELKTLESGKSLLNISIATNDYYKDKEGNKQEKTEWHRLVAWGKTAENIDKLVNKGDEIAIEGKLTHRSYEKDGETRYASEVLVNEFLLLKSVEQK